jgi:hypothetical protein
MGGCVAPVDAPASDLDEPVAAAVPQAQGVALRLEQAERSLDVGRDVPGARAAVEEVLRDPSITREQRDAAHLAHSQALESGGDREGAISEVEALLAGHPERDPWPLADATEARLRKLLTGSEAAPKRSRPDEGRPVAPFARALARYFPVPADEKQPLEIAVAAFGGSGASERLGTFDVPGAIRERRREACSLCEDNLRIHSHSSGFGSWVNLPGVRKEVGSAVAVYYFDLGDRIPARYDADLPLPSAEIAARLERGDGLVAARERPGAPPVIVIAAPRAAQLADVEEALAAMKTIPTEPVVVPLKAPLKPTEIQATVRASFGSFRICYEAVLKQSPTAAGTASMHFAIRGDGSVEAVSAEVSEGALRDPTFEACMTAATSALVFPANRAVSPTTVTYPILFTPGG